VSKGDKRGSHIDPVWAGRGVVVSLLVLACGCAPTSNLRQTPRADDNAAKLVFLTRAGCANTAAMRANLDDALRSLGLMSNYEVIDLDGLPEGDARRGYPTPTLLYENRDVFDLPEPRAPFPEPT
jgi:hypothetical protein